MKNPKNILITGASSGIGAALALEYAKNGVTLLLMGRDKNRLREIADKCRKKNANAEISAVDVTNKNAMHDAILELDDKYPIDLIIANAGISGVSGGVEDPIEEIYNGFNVNVYGVLNTILPAAEKMKKRESGQIAIMSSLASFRGMPSAPQYCATKAAVRSFGEGFRGDMKPYNIGVTVICPGYIRTPMTDVNNFPMPMLMETEEAAKLMIKKLTKNPPRIAFPFPLYFTIWLLGSLSPRLTDWIFNRLPKK